MKQHLFNKENNGKIVVVAALLLLLSACGGGSSSDGSDDVLSELDSTQPATPTDTTADIPLDTIPNTCLLYTSPSPRDGLLSRMPSSA